MCVASVVSAVLDMLICSVNSPAQEICANREWERQAKHNRAGPFCLIEVLQAQADEVDPPSMSFLWGTEAMNKPHLLTFRGLQLYIQDSILFK